MHIPFYLVVTPLGFASNTYFPLESDSLFAQAWLAINPLHHLAEVTRLLLLPNVLSFSSGDCSVIVLLIASAIDESPAGTSNKLTRHAKGLKR